MIGSLRRNLVRDDLYAACAAGWMSKADREKALWIMGATGWTLENVTGVPTDLRDKMLAASSLLRGEDAANEQTELAPTIIDPVTELEPLERFGLQVPEYQTTDDND